VQLIAARMVTMMATGKVTKAAKHRARKTAVNTVSKKFSRRFLPLPMITDGPNSTEITITEASRKDTSMVTTKIDICA